MSEQHTPAPWEVIGDKFRYSGIDAIGQSIVIFGDNHEECGIRGKTHEESLANARRIVACVNACEGIPTDALVATCDDANDLKDFDLAAHALIERVGLRGELELARQQRDELLSALKVALSGLEEFEVFVDGEFGVGRNLDQLEKDGILSSETIATRASIAKAEK